MLSELFWIEGPWRGRLAISARPRGGDWLEDEVRSWRAAGVQAVLSLLTSEEVEELDLTRESAVCEENEIRFHQLPIVDRCVPTSDRDAEAVIRRIQDELESGINVNVHCRQGIGRSAIIAAALLMEAGVPPERAIERIAKARHVPVPETAGQRAWIDQFAASLKR
jgi:protein-tyrosine phosphatase